MTTNKKYLNLFEKGKASELGHITQVRKILKSLIKTNNIVSFERKSERLEGPLVYHIVLNSNNGNNEERRLDLIFNTPDKITLFKGAEVAESSAVKLIIFLNKNCVPKRIKNIIVNDIIERRSGLFVEDAFDKDMTELISIDKEVSRIVKSIKKTGYYDDRHNGIDRFINLTNGKKVPIQIKSSIPGQVKHRIVGCKVPSIVYFIGFPRDLLKKKTLQIIESYPLYIEHL